MGNTNNNDASSIASLPPLIDHQPPSSCPLSPSDLAARIDGRRVALYFSAGWCPMCTSFEPDLLKFRKSAAEAGQSVEIFYVGSDRSALDTIRRAERLEMAHVPFGEDTAATKRKYKIWAGSERGQFGTGRRSGVPAVVVLDGLGEEMAFLAAESEGKKSLESWPLDRVAGVWCGVEDQ